jgi:Kef-type K+ transport system membrane component KefB
MFLLAVHPDDPALESLRRLDVESLLLPVLIQLIVILLAARFFAVLFHRIGQPAVVGEIAAGLVLGPSVLGHLAPGLFTAIFKPTVGDLPPELSDALFLKIFTVISQLGLILLLFLVGLDFDFTHLRLHGKAAVSISIVGVVLPFGLGLSLALLIWPHIEAHPETGQPVPMLGFMLFLGLALSITAIPVLARIMLELGITRTRLGTITMSAAAVDDASGWILLASIATIVRTSSHGYQGFPVGQTLLMVAETFGFFLAMVFVVRPLLLRWLGRGKGNDPLTVNRFAVLLTLVFACAIATNLIGIFAVFGAFLLGTILSDQKELREALISRMGYLLTVFFLPIFFAYTGLRTNIGSLATPLLWLFCALILAAAVFGKLAGCGFVARLSGFSVREAVCVGLLMNTRGLMGLVATNLGYELRVIPPSVFCMLVIMALVTTFVTTPGILRAMPGTELELFIRRSGFLGPPDPTLTNGSAAAPDHPAPVTSPPAD